MSSPPPSSGAAAAGATAPGTDRPLRLVVLFGGRSAEHDISCLTARHVLAAVDHARYHVEPVGITRDGRWVRAEAAREALATGPDALPEALEASGPAIDPLPVLAGDADARAHTVVFPLLHGPLGEDGTIQGLLELADVPYVGCGVLSSALAMDKAAAKDVLSAHGLPQGAWRSLRAEQYSDELAASIVAELGLPVFVKPANMGSSVGVRKASGGRELDEAVALAASYDEWIVVEEAIVGREIECAILGPAGAARASVPGEVVPASEFYDYEEKYVRGTAELHVPARLDDTQTEEVRHLALAAFAALRGEGMARVDFFLEEEGRGWLVNEVNTIPGFTPISMYPRLWDASGIPYPELIDELVHLARRRHHQRPRRTDVSG